MIGMEETQFHILVDEFFLEDLNIENYKKYKSRINTFVYNNKYIDKDTMSKIIADTIIKKSKEKKEILLLNKRYGRNEKGRFEKSNIISSRINASDEQIYLLYLMCGTMEKTANMLGISRQTVSKILHQYS